MLNNSIFCIVRSEEEGNRIVDRLKRAGVSNSVISVLFSNKNASKDFATEMKTKMPEGGSIGASTGGIIGGALGWLAGIGALAIPGVGPFIAAGPLMAALSGAAIGGAVGGITGSLIGLGIPELEAKRYEGKIREGNILISVHNVDSTISTLSKRIFLEEGATDISETCDVGASGKRNDTRDDLRNDTRDSTRNDTRDSMKYDKRDSTRDNLGNDKRDDRRDDIGGRKAA